MLVRGIFIVFALQASMGLSKVQSAHLKTLFEKGDAPYEPNQGDKISAESIGKVYDSNPILQTGTTKKNFYALYRRRAATFLCEETKKGARAGEAGIPATDGSINVENEAVKPKANEPPVAEFASMSFTTSKSLLQLPTLVYQYGDEDGFQYVTVDVLMLSGACTDDMSFSFLSNKSVEITVCIPLGFLHPGRSMWEDRRRQQETIPSKRTALKDAATEFVNQAEDKNNRAIMKLQVDLPIACKPNLRLKPYIGTYMNDYKKEQDLNNNYLVLHLDFLGLEEPNIIPHQKIKSSKTPMASPIGKPLDESSDDEDEDPNDGGGGGGGGGGATTMDHFFEDI